MNHMVVSNKLRKAWSLGTKMSLIMAFIVFVCTLSVVLSVLTYNLRLAVDAERQRLESVSGIFRAVLSVPVAENDRSGAMEALRALKDIPTLRQATVHNADGHVLAEMGGGAVLDRKVLHTSQFSLLDLWSMETLQVTDHIVKGGLTVGKLRLTADITWLASEFRRNLTVALGVAALGILMAFAAGTFLIKRSTRQLSKLADDLSGIGDQENLNLEIRRQTNDEVGVLIDAFNDMMQRINTRDKALRRHSETLEATVAERTHELVLARDEAESANAAKSEFLAMMSHEIRTPMNGMMVMAQMLAAAPLSPRHLRFAEIINRSGQNLLAIINDVLDISKIEAGRLTLEQVPFRMDDILADAHGLFYENARERGLTLTYRIAPDVPIEVEGDGTRLNQVVTNLINNALKFTESGGVTIVVTASGQGSDCILTIEVEDTGIGIAPDKIKGVFERFVQADQSITRRFGGTGLGLAISRHLVEAMGGTISVSSVEGRGSVFKVALPVVGKIRKIEKILAGQLIELDINDPIEHHQMQISLETLGATVIKSGDPSLPSSPTVILSEDVTKVGRSKVPVFQLEPAIGSPETGILNRNRLVLNYPVTRSTLDNLSDALVNGDFTQFRALKRAQDNFAAQSTYRGLHALAVDDNKVNRDVLCEVLNTLGMSVETASNGEEAVKTASHHRFDIIFMDCSMPVMDGFAATRILREHETGKNGRTPIVAITALGSANGRQDWREAGMDGWIAKPFTIPSVTKLLSELVLSSDAGQASPASDLNARYAAIPEVDEQTLSMIARLAMQGGGGQAASIYQLFETNGRKSCASIQEHLKSAQSNADARESLIESAGLLASMASSIGASRLSAIAGDLAAAAKGGDELAMDWSADIQSAFDQSVVRISGRLAVTSDRPKLSSRMN